MLLKQTLAIPADLQVADAARLQTKLERFTQAGPSGMHVILDFDRTLTDRRPGTDDDVTTWNILRDHLPPEAREVHDRLSRKYQSLEYAGLITPDQAVMWWSESLKLFVEQAIDLDDVETDFLQRASIRPGTAELFQLCAERNIPTVILSAGIREVINIWCRKYDITPSLVISTALTLDEGNKIVGWDERTLVHSLNKSVATHPELLHIRAQRPYTFLLGDSVYDSAMAAGDHDVIRARILDPQPGKTMDMRAEEVRTLTQFDAMIRTGSLQPFAELIRFVTQTSRGPRFRKPVRLPGSSARPTDNAWR